MRRILLALASSAAMLTVAGAAYASQQQDQLSSPNLSKGYMTLAQSTGGDGGSNSTGTDNSNSSDGVTGGTSPGSELSDPGSRERRNQYPNGPVIDNNRDPNNR